MRAPTALVIGASLLLLACRSSTAPQEPRPAPQEPRPAPQESRLVPLEPRRPGMGAVPGAGEGEGEAVNGFTVYGGGELGGIVTGADGKPAAGVPVHIAPATGAPRQVVTDAQGRYRAVIEDNDAHTTVYVKGPVRLTSQISAPVRLPEGEAIEIRETIPPAVMPKALADPSRIPEYSEAAKDRGAWVKAWLMLEIDEQGAVARVKLMQKPGHDLDRIAIRDAFALRFEPARDRAGRPMRTMVMWSYEWPSYWWLTEHRYMPDRLPVSVARVPCRGSGGTHKYQRDCSKVDVSKGMAEPWIDRPGP
jgi:hypothetical protein